MLCGLTSVAAAAALARAEPAVAEVVVGSTGARVLIVVGSLVSGAAIVAAGVLEGKPALARIGVAILGLTGAHLYRVLGGQFALSLTFAAVRLLVLLLALWALVQITSETLAAVRDSETERKDEVRHARMSLAQASRLDDELRRRLDRLAKGGRSPGRNIRPGGRRSARR